MHIGQAVILVWFLWCVLVSLDNSSVSDVEGGGVDGVQPQRRVNAIVSIYRIFVYTDSVSTRVAAHVLIDTIRYPTRTTPHRP